jgi:hypothetical protein
VFSTAEYFLAPSKQNRNIYVRRNAKGATSGSMAPFTAGAFTAGAAQMASDAGMPIMSSNGGGWGGAGGGGGGGGGGGSGGGQEYGTRHRSASIAATATQFNADGTITGWDKHAARLVEAEAMVSENLGGDWEGASVTQVAGLHRDISTLSTRVRP